MGLPATEPVMELIAQDIQATLETISPTDVAADYWTTVEVVTRGEKGDPTINLTPHLIVWIDSIQTRDELDAEIYSLNEEDFLVTVEAHMDEQENISRALLRMIRDIRTAIMLDPKRGGNAIHTFITGADTWLPDSTNPRALARCDFRVRYRTRTGDLETVV